MYRGILVVFVTVLSQFIFELNVQRALGNGQPYGHLCEKYLTSISNIMRSNNESDYMYQTYSLFCSHHDVFSRLNELVHSSQFFADTARRNFYQQMLEYGLRSGDYQGADLEVISEFYGYFNKAGENLSRENINLQYQNLITIYSEDIKFESIYGFLPFANGPDRWNHVFVLVLQVQGRQESLQEWPDAWYGSWSYNGWAHDESYGKS